MKVRDVMSKNAVSVNHNASFIEVWNLLFKKHTHAVPVVDNNNRMVGIISTEDLLIKLYPSYSDTMEEFLSESSFEDLEDKIDDVKNFRAKDIMRREVHCSYPDDPVLKAFSKMVVRRIRQLPVIDSDGRLLGVLSKRDVFDKLFLSRLARKK